VADELDNNRLVWLDTPNVAESIAKANPVLHQRSLTRIACFTTVIRSRHTTAGGDA
jgi:hypothetical protein